MSQILTNEEIEELQNKKFSQNGWLWYYTRAVEAKIMEKNAARIQQLEAENEALQLYKNLVQEFGLSVVEDVAVLKLDADRLDFLSAASKEGTSYPVWACWEAGGTLREAIDEARGASDDGPGEEDGPWAAGWGERCGKVKGGAA